jgi:hypothetical protein
MHCIASGVSETLRAPDPVAQDAKQEAAERDVPVGAVIEDWRDKARRYERLEGEP